MVRPTRSQRQPTQTQASPSQPRRHRRSRADDDDDEEEDEEATQIGANEMDADETNPGNNELDRKAHDLVRVALFNENKRTPLRRDEISKKVFGSGTRSFNTVLAMANNILRKTFGMELVELQNASADKDAAETQATELLKKTGVKKKAAPTGTKSYILRSTLDPALVAAACAPDAAIRELEAKERNTEAYADFVDPADDAKDAGARSTGSIFAWHASDELPALGVLYVVLALILVQGRVVADGDLRNLLKRLQLPAHAQIPATARATHAPLGVDAFLTAAVRHGYLDRTRLGAAPGAKRARGGATQAAQEGTADEWEWRWGARAMAEIGEQAIAEFIADFMVDRGRDEQSEDEGEEGGQRAHGERDAASQKQFDLLVRGIERAAAGSVLQNARA